LSCSGPKDQQDHTPNVLLIAIDDLNDWVGCLDGHPDTRTPNIDRLAERGVLFTNAHCQGTMCNPSRISIMWGKRPSSTGFYSNHYPAKNAPEFLKSNVSLSRHFASNGYKTLTAGKIYHASWLPENDFHVVGPRPGQWLEAHDEPVQEKPEQYHPIWDFGPQNYDEEEFVDYRIASWGVKQLQEKHDKPFFCALGFMRPHVPFFPPQRVYNSMKDTHLPKVKEDDWSDLPEAAAKLTLSNEKIPTHDWMKEAERWQLAVRAYLACVNWVDEQIGRVLDALEESPYADNTIILLYTDHGYHLGEKQRWSKFSLWERTTKVPFIISMPGGAKGISTKPVELLSIYPTLIDLCELPQNADIEGVSLRPLLENPNAPWEYVAISTLGQNNHAVRDERWRYIKYADGSEELYDHQTDTNEWNNLAIKPELAGELARLQKLLPKVNVEQMSAADQDTK
ncbi:MAG: sulfatase, partial [Saprospiraceae bacterium]|nr:sulfatase [Saprospiraceae bacterium]